MRNFRAKHLPIKADRTWQIFSPYNIFQFLDAHVSASRKSGRTATHNADKRQTPLTPVRPFQSTFPRLEIHMPHRTLFFLGLTGLFLVSAALADQPLGPDECVKSLRRCP